MSNFVCNAYGKFLLHNTVTKIHPEFVETFGGFPFKHTPGGQLINIKWKKLFSIARYGFYWKVK